MAGVVADPHVHEKFPTAPSKKQACFLEGPFLLELKGEATFLEAPLASNLEGAAWNFSWLAPSCSPPR